MLISCCLDEDWKAQTSCNETGKSVVSNFVRGWQSDAAAQNRAGTRIVVGGGGPSSTASCPACACCVELGWLTFWVGVGGGLVGEGGAEGQSSGRKLHPSLAPRAAIHGKADRGTSATTVRALPILYPCTLPPLLDTHHIANMLPMLLILKEVAGVVSARNSYRVAWGACENTYRSPKSPRPGVMYACSSRPASTQAVICGWGYNANGVQGRYKKTERECVSSSSQQWH